MTSQQPSADEELRIKIEDGLLQIDKQVSDRAMAFLVDLIRQEKRAMLDRLEATSRTADNCAGDTYVIKTKFIQAERDKLK